MDCARGRRRDAHLGDLQEPRRGKGLNLDDRTAGGDVVIVEGVLRLTVVGVGGHDDEERAGGIAGNVRG